MSGPICSGIEIVIKPRPPEPSQAGFPFWEPCECWDPETQFTCESCGRTFCGSCEGTTHARELCDGCFSDSPHATFDVEGCHDCDVESWLAIGGADV